MRMTASTYVFCFNVGGNTPTVPRHLTWRQIKKAGFARPHRTVREDRAFFNLHLTERSVNSRLW